jgi:signal transduction histidine kinase
MIEQLLESAAFGWPLALSCASAIALDRVRSSRRRTRLNRAMHELRRPLQALMLGGSARAHVDLAVEALADLDREINGGAPAPPMRVEARGIAEDAIERWRVVAARSGRRLELAWSANGSQVICRPGAIASALDNLIVNALEHGAGPIRLEAGVASGRLRLRVSDGGGAAPRVAAEARPDHRLAASRRRDPRRGHGLRVVARIAAEHGGRFVACRHAAGASAVIELPLAEPLPQPA